MKSEKAKEIIAKSKFCDLDIDFEDVVVTGTSYVKYRDAVSAVIEAEKEIEATFTERAVAAFNKACALMQNCRHCNGDCFCEEKFTALITNPEADLCKCDT